MEPVSEIKDGGSKFMVALVKYESKLITPKVILTSSLYRRLFLM